MVNLLDSLDRNSSWCQGLGEPAGDGRLAVLGGPQSHYVDILSIPDKLISTDGSGGAETVPTHRDGDMRGVRDPVLGEPGQSCTEVSRHPPSHSILASYEIQVTVGSGLHVSGC